MELIVQSTGDVRCLYGEELNLAALGKLSIQRGSHVEPTDDGRWTADLHSVASPDHWVRVFKS